jgi:hypothetical protein
MPWRNHSQTLGYAEDDLARIRAARARAPFPQVDGFVPLVDAVEQTKKSETTILSRLKAGALSTHRVDGKTKDGRPWQRCYIPARIVDDLLRNPKSSDMETYHEAARMLGTTYGMVQYFVAAGHLTAAPGEALCANGQRRLRKLVRRAEVEDLAKRRRRHGAIWRVEQPNGTPTSQLSSADSVPRSRGRPRGQDDATIHKRKKILADCRTGQYSTREIADRHHCSPAYVRNVRCGLI